MWKIHSYYLREISVNTVLTFLVLFGIALIALLYKGISMVQGGNLLDALLTTILLAADAIPHLLTISLLFGCVMAFSRASQEREITAIRSAGISPRVPLVAALLVGMVFSLFGTWALHYQIPWAHYHKYRVAANVVKRALSSHMTEMDRISLGSTGAMTWKRQDKNKVYHTVMIFLKDPKYAARFGGTVGQGVTLVTAERAWVVQDQEEDSIGLHLETVFAPVEGFRVGSTLLTLPLGNKEFGRRHANERDLQSDSLLSEVYRGVRRNPVFDRFTVHRRACFALMPFLMASLGFSIGILSRERGRVLALSYCMVPLCIFYTCDVLSARLLLYWDWPGLAWLPAAVIVLLGAPFTWRFLRY